MSTTTGAKRGRKPKGGASPASSPAFPSPQFQQVHWATPATPANAGASTSTSAAAAESSILPSGGIAGPSRSSTSVFSVNPQSTPSSSSPVPALDMSGLLAMPNIVASSLPPKVTEDDVAATGEGDDELLPAMADDDYSAQLSWQSQSKDNLKVLMDNFSADQYERFEAYRRHALSKGAVRKVIQQTLGQQVSQPVAQIIAGFSKVFVGEIVEKARAVQARRGDTGPLSPDHLREAYRMYQQETGRVGAARPVKGKRLFVR